MLAKPHPTAPRGSHAAKAFSHLAALMCWGAVIVVECLLAEGGRTVYTIQLYLLLWKEQTCQVSPIWCNTHEITVLSAL